jgi:hypothetical protein
MLIRLLMEEHHRKEAVTRGLRTIEFEFELDALGRDAARQKADFPGQCQSRLIFSEDNAAQSLQAFSR